MRLLTYDLPAPFPIVLAADEGTFLCTGGGIVAREEAVPEIEGRVDGRDDVVVVAAGLFEVLPANDWRGFAGLVTGLRVVEEEAGGRDEVDDDSVVRRSLAEVPDIDVLVVAGRLVVLVAIRFESPF